MRLDEYFFCFCIPCAFKSYIYIFGVLVVLSSIAPEIKRSLKLLNVCDGVMKVTLVMKVCRFCKQILSMRLLCLCFSSIDVQTLHN